MRADRNRRESPRPRRDSVKKSRDSSRNCSARKSRNHLPSWIKARLARPSLSKTQLRVCVP
jgi:hypothetical protein